MRAALDVSRRRDACYSSFGWIFLIALRAPRFIWNPVLELGVADLLKRAEKLFGHACLLSQEADGYPPE